MNSNGKIVVVGLGEVGKPLLELVSQSTDAVGVDIVPIDLDASVDVLHICYPYQIRNFVAETVRYIDRYRPALTVINSTVGVGTTRVIAERASAAVVNSPVRGKHANMGSDLLKYTKFVGAMNPSDGALAVAHFTSVGLKTKLLSSPEATELAKLTETTYFGLMIAWAQELERYCDRFGEDYDEVSSFYEEIKFFPAVKYFPGVIGGHCVMPNIEILSQNSQSVILDAIRVSNRMKIERDAQEKDARAGIPVGSSTDYLDKLQRSVR